jgi:outer membrane protein assembly factor BamA
MKKLSLILFLLTFILDKGYGQVKQDSTLIGERRGTLDRAFDFGDDVINFISGEKWAFIPAISYSPETSLGLGVRAIRVFKYKETASTTLRPSSLPITFLYTLNNQLIFTTELELWAKENKEYFNGRLELANFPFKFFGIGNEGISEAGEFYTTQYAYLHLNYERLLTRGLYLGPRYEFRIDDISNRVPGGILESTEVPGFDGQRVSGLGLVLNYDTRDNIFQPQNGWFNQISWMNFSTFFGSQFSYNRLLLDFRKYVRVHEQQVLALQSWWSFIEGDAPFQQVSLIGGPDRMRGYFEGKFRDRHAMVHQLEYRFRVYRNLGMVVFAHAGQVAADIGQFDWQRFRYGGGFGFRYKLTPDGLNIRLDIAFGDQRAFYFGLNEVF